MIWRKDYRNLLLVEPLALASPQININKIEQFCKNEFLITYEISRAAKAAQARAGSPGEYPVILTGTNSAWLSIMGFPLLDGSFFSEQAWEGKLRRAALNKEAARTIFGSVKAAGNRLHINRETWIVTGVVDDGDRKHCRIYAPSSIGGGTADALMALLDSAGRINEGYAKNSLKSLGVQAKDFTFYNLENVSRLPVGRALTAFGILVIALLSSAVPPLWKKIRALCRDLRGELKNHYLRELPSLRLNELFRLAALIFVLAAAGAAMLILALNLAALCLPWQDLPDIADLNPVSFSSKLAALKSAVPPSRILFWAALGFTGIFAAVGISALFRKK
jgi:hypothetical protein